MKKRLHPGTRWLFRLKGYSTLFFLIIFLIIFSSSFIFRGTLKNVNNVFNTISIGILIVIILTILISEIYAQMSYDRWFYDFTDSQLRIERGIIWKNYSNIPYERVQNVDISRGIVARICGFSTVNIQTAGFSYTPKRAAHSEGYIPGVPMEEAEHIREFLMKKISKKSRSGL